jgi:hypothetical protein
VKTLQSIKNGISMLDERRATIDVNGATGNDVAVDERWEDEAGEPADAPR